MLMLKYYCLCPPKFQKHCKLYSVKQYSQNIWTKFCWGCLVFKKGLHCQSEKGQEVEPYQRCFRGTPTTCTVRYSQCTWYQASLCSHNFVSPADTLLLQNHCSWFIMQCFNQSKSVVARQTYPATCTVYLKFSQIWKSSPEL